MARIESFTVIVLLFFFGIGMGQELPPIVNFSPEEYSADNQNWMLSQSDDGHIFVANNRGLLEFNGSKWELYPSPNGSIIRSVNVIDERVYTGCYMNFGYWERNEFGALEYTSLSDTLKIEILEDEQFWNIIQVNRWLLFQSLDRILILNTDSNEVVSVEVENTINKSFKLRDRVFFQVSEEGLYSIENGAKRLIDSSYVAKQYRFISVFTINNMTVFITEKNGFYQLKDSRLEKWNSPVDELLRKLTIYSGLQTNDESIFLGSISNGVYKLSNDGVLEYNLNQADGLANNTVLNLFEDRDTDIWLGLDYGVDCINMDTPLQTYYDPIGRLGTTYSTINHKGYLYLGTNQGLFYKKTSDDTDFEIISGTEGQVWKLISIDGDLFCGHNTGTFLVNGGTVSLISSLEGAWDLMKSPTLPGILVQGNYDGLYTLVKEDNRWQIRSKIKGFDISSRNFELSSDNRIIVNHEYKGVYELQLDSMMSRVLSVRKLESVEKSMHSSLAKFDGNIIYASNQGLHVYDPSKREFIREKTLSTIFDNDEYISGKLVSDKLGQLWAFTKNYIVIISREKLGGSVKIDKIAIPHRLRNDMKGFENVSVFDDGRYCIGTANGYMILEPGKIIDKQLFITIDRVTSASYSGDKRSVSIEKPGNFESNDNSFIFEFSVPQFEKYSAVDFRYRLSNNDSTWSTWNSAPRVSIENLKYGTYTFEVQGRVNNELTSNSATYGFVIKKPWYLSKPAITLFALLLILMFLSIHWFYRRYYKRQRARILEKTTNELKLKELESQKEIIQLKNESLNQEIKARNRELAISTMNMIRKNTALNNIKDELKKLKDNNKLGQVIKLIDKSINNKEEWKFFEEAFNHADKDFFKKVKELHPELTSNDLRLCVYLRLNLSSKEIAPLLNISPRSVEIKRYRLRKKIKLDREYNLNNYFIEL